MRGARRAAGFLCIPLREIPYKGAGPGLTAVLAGQVALVFGNALTVQPHIQSGRLRALGIASPKRSAALPDLPTLAELYSPNNYRVRSIVVA